MIEDNMYYIYTVYSDNSNLYLRAPAKLCVYDADSLEMVLWSQSLRSHIVFRKPCG